MKKRVSNVDRDNGETCITVPVRVVILDTFVCIRVLDLDIIHTMKIFIFFAVKNNCSTVVNSFQVSSFKDKSLTLSLTIHF